MSAPSTPLDKKRVAKFRCAVLTKRCHVPRPQRVNSHTDNEWVEVFGDKVITAVFAYEGGIVLVSDEPCTASGSRHLYYGLRTQGEVAEWGLIDVTYFEHLEANREAEARHMDMLPCKLEKLFDCTTVHTYFLHA
jgi:hypothetical protein